MADIHSLILRSDSTQIKNSATDLDKLSRSAKNADGTSSKFNDTTKKTTASLAGMKTAVVSVVTAMGAYTAVKAFTNEFIKE